MRCNSHTVKSTLLEVQEVSVLFFVFLFLFFKCMHKVVRPSPLSNSRNEYQPKINSDFQETSSEASVLFGREATEVSLKTCNKKKSQRMLNIS